MTCLTLICVITAIRLALVRTAPVDKQINQVVIFGMLSALFREPAIAERLAHFIPGGVLVINDLWHFCFVMTCVACVGLFLLREEGPEHYHRTYRMWVASACTIGVLFLVLSHPARQRGLLLQDALGWQYGVYFVLYAVLQIAACFIAFGLVRSLRKKAAGLREKAVVTVIFLIAFGGAINTSVLAAGAIVASAGVDNGFTRETEIRAGGELLLPFVAFTFLILVPTTLKALARLFRLDADSQEARTLRPLWRDLAESAAPEVILPLPLIDRLGATPEEHLYRRRMEIRDAISIVSRYAGRLDDALDDYVEDTVPDDIQEDVRSALELMAAVRYLAEVGGTEQAGPPPYPRRPIPDIDALARAWPHARTLLESPSFEGAV
uniref:DUF6545 domain-containing protein n=1 Tax=Rhodococcus opacus TaxID=37919 RepID=UPI00117D1413|nr:DUF6545 domain-containing protein [Rhodococcus opacus]UDH01724.1 hypothetical protein K2Z90_008246 [Rhodococcus opacus PD630]